MKRMELAILAIMAFAGAAHAQTYQQFHDELFCHDMGNSAYQALADYRNGLPLDEALKRADGYLCTDRLRKVCEIKRGMLRQNIQLSYKIGDGEHVRDMTATQYLKLNDANRADAISTCMEVARR